MPTDPVVILTREAGDNRSLADRLETMNIPVFHYPCIRTRFLPFPPEEAEAVRLEDFQAVVFTSKRGVAGVPSLYPRLADPGQRLAVVGETTAAALREAVGRAPGIVASPPTGEALAHRLVQLLPAGAVVLHIRGSRSTGRFKQIMETLGFRVQERIVYCNEMPHPDPLPPGLRGLAVFASPSAAACFFKYNRSEDLENRLVYLAIGPVTGGYLKKTGIPAVFEACRPDNDGLIKEIRMIIEGGYIHDTSDRQFSTVRPIV